MSFEAHEASLRAVFHNADASHPMFDNSPSPTSQLLDKPRRSDLNLRDNGWPGKPGQYSYRGGST